MKVKIEVTFARQTRGPLAAVVISKFNFFESQFKAYFRNPFLDITFFPTQSFTTDLSSCMYVLFSHFRPSDRLD